jgi:hypothetical protein
LAVWTPLPLPWNSAPSKLSSWTLFRKSFRTLEKPLPLPLPSWFGQDHSGPGNDPPYWGSLRWSWYPTAPSRSSGVKRLETVGSWLSITTKPHSDSQDIWVLTYQAATLPGEKGELHPKAAASDAKDRLGAKPSSGRMPPPGSPLGPEPLSGSPWPRKISSSASPPPHLWTGPPRPKRIILNCWVKWMAGFPCRR